jgi:tartrate/fumarate subfamily iron-sulfur-dependent hydro-lyase beta chain
MVIGKGFMGEATANALKNMGGVYVVTTGGTAAYYADKIKEVKAVHWLELGMPAAVWVFRAENLGPLIVALDSHGSNIFTELTAKVDSNINEMYDEMHVDRNRKYLWWP